MRAHWKLAAGILLALGALHVLTGLLSDPPPPGGPRSSSYASGGDGVGAYAALLRRSGHPVARTRERLDRAGLDPADVLVVLETPVRPEEAAAITAFVRAGGTVIAGGADVGRWLNGLVPAPPRAGGHAVPVPGVLAPVAETAGVSRLAVAGFGDSFAWSPPTSALPVAGGEGGAVVAVANAGSGRVVMVADPSVFWNDQLGRADNAAFGLAVAPGSRRVVFAEYAHGYGHSGGLRALPTSIRFVLAGLAAATLLFYWARSRRLGPPSRPDRALPPPRAAFVDALATTLVRTSDRAAAIAPLRAEARRSLAGGASGTAADAMLRRQAADRGLTHDEISAVLGDGGDPETLLAAGRALAKLHGAEGENR